MGRIFALGFCNSLPIIEPPSVFPDVRERKGGMQMADSVSMTPPRLKTEAKIGNTTYIVTAHYASQGVTVSQKIKRLLDRETRKNPG